MSGKPILSNNPDATAPSFAFRSVPLCSASEAFLPPRRSSFLPAFVSLADAISGRSTTALLLVAILERRALLDMDGWKAADCWAVIAPMVMIAAYDFIVVGSFLRGMTLSSSAEVMAWIGFDGLDLAGARKCGCRMPVPDTKPLRVS